MCILTERLQPAKTTNPIPMRVYEILDVCLISISIIICVGFERTVPKVIPKQRNYQFQLIKYYSNRLYLMKYKY